MDKVEESFKQLQGAGKNCVDCLLEWIKESKIIDETKEAEEKARQLFEEVVEKHNVELEKEVMTKLAAEQKKSVEELSEKLIESMPKFQKALGNASKAFMETMREK